jgi:hypothetical protein
VRFVLHPAGKGKHKRVELDLQLFRSRVIPQNWVAVGSIFTAQDTSYELQRKSSTHPQKTIQKLKTI